MTLLNQDVIKRYQTNQGYVYLIHALGTDRYKIGRSVNPVARFETLKKQSPYPLKIIECFWTPDAIADEKYFHEIGWLSQKRKHGEWFELNVQPDPHIGISEVEHLALQFNSCSPTCHRYLDAAVKHIKEQSGLFNDRDEKDCLFEIHDPFYSLYKAIRNLDDLQKIVSFTIECLGWQVEGCKELLSA